MTNKTGGLMVALLYLFFADATQAQSKAGAYLIGQAGWTAPARQPGFIAEIASGVRYGRWGLGLATGADEATVKSMPLLVDLRWRIFTGPHALEIFSQQGLNLLTESPPVFHTYQHGAYWHGGLTWRLYNTSVAGGCWISAGCRYRSYTDTGDADLLVPGTGMPGPLGYNPPPTITHQQDWSGVLTIGWRF